MSAFVDFIDFLGKMGLILRGDPPRSIDMTDRVWGDPVEYFALSVREIRKEDPDQLAAVSVVMKNNGNENIPFTIPGWMFFYSVKVAAPLSAYGTNLLKPERSNERLQISLGPGDATETDVPVGTLYALRKQTDYTVSVSCTLPNGSELRSNQIRLRA